MRIKLSIFLMLISYIIVYFKHDLIFLFMASCLLLVYNLIKVYQDRSKYEHIKYSVLSFIDISYMFLGRFDLIYIGVYLFTIFALFFYDYKQSKRKGISTLMFLGYYNLFKLVLVIFMMMM